jgi:hypothetical protein
LCFSKSQTLAGFRELPFAQQAVDNRHLTISFLVRSNQYNKVGVMDITQLTTDERQWFVMRDLKRRNAKQPAYLMFKDKGIEFFTPMVHKLLTIHGKREDREVPFMQDLLFVKETKEKLDIIVEAIPTLQYRYKLGVQHTPIVVRNTDMERFIKAVEATENPKYYRPEEITPDMLNRKIRIIGGQLDGYIGTLVTTRGSKTKRLLVELPMLLAAAVEVNTEYIQLI